MYVGLDGSLKTLVTTALSVHGLFYRLGVFFRIHFHNRPDCIT